MVRNFFPYYWSEMNQGWTNINFAHEFSLGMTEFFRQTKDKGGIPCTLKSISEDFHVHEIDYNGNILHLTEIYSKNHIAVALAKAKADEAGASIVVPDFELTFELKSVLENIMTDADISRLIVFVRSICSSLKDTTVFEHPTLYIAGKYPESCIDDESTRKNFRTQFHLTIKEHLPFLSSEAVDANRGDVLWDRVSSDDIDTSTERSGWRLLRLRPTSKCLRAFQIKIQQALPTEGEAKQQDEEEDAAGEEPSGKKPKKENYWAAKKKNNSRNNNNNNNNNDNKREYPEGDRWPKNRPPYLHFLVFKRMRETVNAQALLARVSGRPVRTFAFAGMKDRRATTVQMLSGHKVSAEALKIGLTHSQWDANVRIQPLDYEPEGLFLGRLVGNHFRVVLRNVPSSISIENKNVSTCQVLQDASTRLSKQGFINYFGSQRFGTGLIIRSHHVGAALMTDKFLLAVRLLLGDETALHAAFPKSAITSIALKNRDGCELETPVQEEDSKLLGDVLWIPASPVNCKNSTSAVKRASPTDNGADDGAAIQLENTEVVVVKEREPEATLEELLSMIDAGEYHAALDRLPSSRRSTERSLVFGLLDIHRDLAADINKNGGVLDREQMNAAIGVMLSKQLTRQQRSLFVHSAQSLLWNAAVSHRLSTLGHRVVVGDFVVPARQLHSKIIENSDEENNGDNNIGDAILIETAEEAAQYTIFDVVLPSLGANMPANCAKWMLSLYDDLCLRLLALETCIFTDKNYSRTHPIGSCLKSEMRHIAVLPTDVKSVFVPAHELNTEGSNKMAPIINDDLDLLKGINYAPKSVLEAGLEPPPTFPVEKIGMYKDLDEGLKEMPFFSVEEKTEEKTVTDNGAIVMTLSLPKSSYLTVALREIVEPINNNPE